MSISSPENSVRLAPTPQRHSQRQRRSPRLLASITRAAVERLEGRTLLSGAGHTPTSVLLGTTPYTTDFNVNTDTEPYSHVETSIAVNPTNPLNMVGDAVDYQSSID